LEGGGLKGGFAAELVLGERANSARVGGFAVEARTSWADISELVDAGSSDSDHGNSVASSGVSRPWMSKRATLAAGSADGVPKPRRMRLSRAARRLKAVVPAAPAVNKGKGKGKNYGVDLPGGSFAGLFAVATTITAENGKGKGKSGYSSASGSGGGSDAAKSAAAEVEQLRILFQLGREKIGARKKDSGPLLKAVEAYESMAVLVLVRNYLVNFPKWTIVQASSELDRIDINTALEWIVGFVC
jgi:hypothetical protein